MGLRELLTEWLNVRDSEFRIVALSVLGAFFIMGFTVLAGALRDAFYLGFFEAATLPYILYAGIGLGLPAVAAFSRLTAARSPRGVMRGVILLTSAGLLILYALAQSTTTFLSVRVLAVIFYLWTVVAALLLTSGFWIIVSDMFVVREAKRLFGLISAGGAMGTLVIGLLVPVLLTEFRPIRLVPLLVGLLVLAVIVIELVPRDRLESRRRAGSEPETSTPTILRSLASSRHLGLIAGIVLLTSAASYIVTWQLQEAIQLTAIAEAARAGLAGDAAQVAVNTRIASFMGAFRGWTGGLAFVIQVFIASRVLAGSGIAWSLSVLPLSLLLGSAGMVFFPGLFLATLVRGADNTLGKSMHRTVTELLWVPVFPALRRRVKAFIDSMVDNAGDGLGAAFVLAWVTIGHQPSRYLSLFVIATSLVLLLLAKAMGTQYFVTLRRRLEGSGSEAEVLEAAGLDRADRLGATLTRLDITRVLGTAEVHGDASAPWIPRSNAGGGTHPAPRTPSEMLRSGDPALIAAAMEAADSWSPEDVPILVPLLAREPWLGPAVRAIAAIGVDGVPYLNSVLSDETADFVIRRRIPRVLGRIDHPVADRTLIDALDAGRFEVRYRAALALYQRRRAGLAEATGNWRDSVWAAIRAQLGREKPVWELARLLDAEPEDGFVERRVGARGELSLEHTFRTLSLVLDADSVRAAYHGILLDDPELKSFALEYLEQVLPADVRLRLWPFIGDLSAAAERRAIRELDDVVADLLQTGDTLFGSPEDREALQKFLRGGEGRSDDAGPSDGES